MPALSHILTYLFGVCLFSISFLVFVNSTVSFVITDIIGQRSAVGTSVGTLGFADELVALVACPFWGLLSDRIGLRTVTVLGFAIVGLSLFVFVQAENVYPQLLLARILFSLGGAATATMVTAVLPSVTVSRKLSKYPEVVPRDSPILGRPSSTSISSEATITPARLAHGSPNEKGSRFHSLLSGSRLPGFVGAFAGLGALVALGCFLPLPSQFQKLGISPRASLKDAYYFVATIALVVSFFCFVGLRGLRGEQQKSIYALWRPKGNPEQGSEHRPYWKLLVESVEVAWHYPNICLGYIGGFVARASSVGISLFIPLLVNHYYISSGLCRLDDETQVKSQCKEAYVVAAKLTGVSQLVALFFAPVFGFFSDKVRSYHLPLLIAAVSGLLGYGAIAFFIKTPDPSRPGGSYWIYPVVSLLGVGQIGSIVCSLELLSSTITASMSPDAENPALENRDIAPDEQAVSDERDDGNGEAQSLLRKKHFDNYNLSHLQGSIAGTYSLAGGAGILLLTKLGGTLFDTTSPSSPFIMLMAFYAVLFAATLAIGAVQARAKLSKREAE